MALQLDQAPRGTLLHCIWLRPSLEPDRQRLVPVELLTAVQQHLGTGGLDTTAWTRALVPSPAALVPPPPAEATFEWVVQSTDGGVCGTVYTEGSLIDGPPRFASLCGRRGWAFVAVNEVG